MASKYSCIEITQHLNLQLCSQRKKATMHHVTTMLVTSKNVLFPGHNYLLTTGTDDLILWLSPKYQLVWKSGQKRWPGKDQVRSTLAQANTLWRNYTMKEQFDVKVLIQPWICAPGTHYGWVDQGSVEYEVCPTLLHMASTGNRTPDLLILSPINALSSGPHAPQDVLGPTNLRQTPDLSTFCISTIAFPLRNS